MGARAALLAHLRRRPRDTVALRALAEVLVTTDGVQEAARCLEHLGLIHAGQGQMTDAGTALQDALRLWPEFGSALHNLGNVQRSLDLAAESEATFRRAIRVAPTALTCNSLGHLLESQGRLADAADCFRHATTLAPDDADSHANLAAALRKAGRLADAGQRYRAALKLDPSHEQALTGLAVLLDLEGKYHDGLALLQEHADSPDAAVPLSLAYGRLLRHAGRPDEAIRILSAQLERIPEDKSHQRWLHFSLGDLLDDIGKYDEAFAHFEAANRMSTTRFSAGQCAAFVARHRETLSATVLAGLPRAEARAIRPVFIVGMPRSGTTLVEQILSCHSQVYAGGERNDVLNAARSVFGYRPESPDYPDSLLTAQAKTLEHIAQRYHAEPDLPSGVSCMTDKYPGNFRLLGLIELLFPNAMVVNCRRQPLDCGLSVFTRDLVGPEFSFSSRLEHIGIYYRQYERLMQHWRRTLRLPIFDLDYEVLINTQETSTRRLLDFLGLTWEPACLEFHRHERTVNTASHAQVRRPMYKDAIDRFRNYEKHLQPLMQELQELSHDGD